MKHFYLFCNYGYGKSFQTAFLRFSKRHPDIQCTIVFSGPENLRQSGFKPVRILTRAFRDLAARLSNTLFCADINADDFIASLPANSIGFVAGFNQIFSNPFISRFQDLINFHPSILPFYRGAIPSYWILKNKETVTGYTAHRIIEKIDAGPFLHQQYVEIPAGIDEHGLDKLVGSKASVYFNDLLEALVTGKPLEIIRLDSPYRVSAGYLTSRRKE